MIYSRNNQTISSVGKIKALNNKVILQKFDGRNSECMPVSFLVAAGAGLYSRCVGIFKTQWKCVKNLHISD
jgi:hypothetical protein